LPQPRIDFADRTRDDPSDVEVSRSGVVERAVGLDVRQSHARSGRDLRQRVHLLAHRSAELHRAHRHFATAEVLAVRVARMRAEGEAEGGGVPHDIGHRALVAGVSAAQTLTEVRKGKKRGRRTLPTSH
jgi:hypothetical protein